MRVMLEFGPKGKRVAAVAPDWPGLERGAKTEEAAIERLLAYLPRYASIAKLAAMDAEFAAITGAEVKKLGIPVTAIVDSNSDPDGIAYPIPGNDDAARALVLYCDLVARAIIDGIGQGQVESGVDVGEAEVLQDTRPQAETAEAQPSA